MLRQPLLIAVKDGGVCWKFVGTETGLGHRYIYQVSIGNKARQVVIEPGFLTDGASSPRLFWTLVGFLPRGIHDPAALIHDYLFFHRGRVRDIAGRMQTFTQKECDQIFLRALQSCGVKSWKAYMAYIAVRLFGWYYWNKNEPKKAP